jgi:acyl carrier protein
MGLDSVELVLEIEKYFEIQISDAEAEKISTVQDMVDVVASHLNISDNSANLRDDILQRINDALLKLGLIEKEIKLDERIVRYISPQDERFWKVLEDELQLKVPAIYTINKKANKLIDKIKSAFNLGPLYNAEETSVEEFIAAICAANDKQLIDRKTIKSTYEIYIGVIGVTVDKIGVDYYEITPEKSFTNDLGVD